METHTIILNFEFIFLISVNVFQKSFEFKFSVKSLNSRLLTTVTQNRLVKWAKDEQSGVELRSGVGIDWTVDPAAVSSRI